MRSIFPRYLFASIVALAFDYAILLLLAHRTSLPAAASGALAYSAGAVIHYLLSRVCVFEPGWLHDKRLSELAAFVLTGLAGLLITAAFLEAGTRLFAFPIPVSKTAAVGASFAATYLMRRRIVFRH